MSDEIVNVEVDVAPTVEVSESEIKARKFGWVPKEEFRGDPETWRDADAFLQRGQEINGFLRADLNKLNAKNVSLEAELREVRDTLKEFRVYHQEIDRRAYERALKDLRQEKKDAIALGDGERVVEIEEQIEQLKEQHTAPPQPTTKQEQPTVDPVFVEWVTQNQWYVQDADLAIFADGYAEKLRKQRPDLVGVEFLSEVEQKVRSTFKPKFENQRRAQPSPVGSSTPARGTANNKKTFADLPAEAKTACEKFVKQGLLTKEQYVKEYFGE